MWLEVFLRVFNALIFFEILDSIVSISKGSEAAKRIASISLSSSVMFGGKLYNIIFF